MIRKRGGGGSSGTEARLLSTTGRAECLIGYTGAVRRALEPPNQPCPLWKVYQINVIYSKSMTLTEFRRDMVSRVKERLWASVREPSRTKACGGRLSERRTVWSTCCRRWKRSARYAGSHSRSHGRPRWPMKYSLRRWTESQCRPSKWEVTCAKKGRRPTTKRTQAFKVTCTSSKRVLSR